MNLEDAIPNQSGQLQRSHLTQCYVLPMIGVLWRYPEEQQTNNQTKIRQDTNHISDYHRAKQETST